MKGIKRALGNLILVIIFVSVVFVLYLELGSRKYVQEMPDRECPLRVVCDLTRYPVNQEKIRILNGLVQKRQEGVAVTREDLDRAMILVPEEDMIALNGIYCNDQIYVSRRLPEAARYYVARHELEHVFQNYQVGEVCEDPEFCANCVAGREYPFGLLQTITSSLVAAYRLSPSLEDFLFSAWLTFKAYFLAL